MKLIENGLFNFEALADITPSEYLAVPFILGSHIARVQYENAYSAAWWLVNELNR